MKHSFAKKERELIFTMFADNRKLKFSEIEKKLNIRSNMVAYHLEQMAKEGVLNKNSGVYSLTREGEKYLPIANHLNGAEMSPLPVVIVALMNKDKILMIKRNKRPYQNYWGLLGGKMLLEESFEQATLRQVKTKSGLMSKFVSINSVMHERVTGEGIVKHSFILFFTKAVTEDIRLWESEYGEIKWVKLADISKEKVIPSDLWLIQNKLDSKVSVNNVSMLETQGELSSFHVSA